MSTYANPTTVIDRESGKIWGETIQNVGKLTVLRVSYFGVEADASPLNP